MEKTNDGFELANEDLAIRGPGDFWGVRQHGLGNLKVANLLKDQKIIEMVSRAFDSINELNVDERTMASYMENKFPEMDRIARN
jgi:ATP-dependent DNA helicase RecG